MSKKFLTIFVIALLIRLISLNQSLWLDEATTARVVKDYGFTQIIREFSPTDFHPPLYYLFMKLWTNVFGYGEVALRFPSVIFSLLTGWVIYKIVRLHLGKPDYGKAVWAATFFLFNPLIIYYSQEARQYMMVTLFLSASLYFFLALISNIKNQISKIHIKDQIFFNLFIFLSLSTFYGSIFLVATFLLYFLYKKQYINLFICLLVVFVYFLTISPLLYQQVSNARQQLQLVPNWRSVLGGANIKNLLLIPLKFSVGRISFQPKWLYWGISGAWTLFVWIFILKGGLKNKFLFFLVIGSLGFGILFSFFTPLLQYFRFLYLIPILSILITLGSAKYHRFGGMWLVLIGYIVFSFAYLLIPTFHREDWKSLAKSIPAREVYMVYSSSDPVQYYRSQLKIVDIRSLPNIRLSGKEIFVIPYSADIHGVDYQKILAKKKYKLVQQLVFRGLLLEKWKFYSSM